MHQRFETVSASGRILKLNTYQLSFISFRKGSKLLGVPQKLYLILRPKFGAVHFSMTKLFAPILF